jgi:hypothetical protein
MIFVELRRQYNPHEWSCNFFCEFRVSTTFQKINSTIILHGHLQLSTEMTSTGIVHFLSVIVRVRIFMLEISSTGTCTPVVRKICFHSIPNLCYETGILTFRNKDLVQLKFKHDTKSYSSYLYLKH